jgi:hypothetical protein
VGGPTPRESLKLFLDAFTTIFHSYLHDTPCGIPRGMEGLAELLNETPRRKEIKKAISKSNRMVAFVEYITVSGIWAKVNFCTGKKIDYSFSIHYRWEGKTFDPYFSA